MRRASFRRNERYRALLGAHRDSKTTGIQTRICATPKPTSDACRGTSRGPSRKTHSLKENNAFTLALGWISIVGFIGGGIFWLIGLGEQTRANSFRADGTEGLWAFALGGHLMTLGAAATLLWLVVRAIIDQLAHTPRADLPKSTV